MTQLYPTCAPMFNNQVYQFWGVIWAITAVAGAVLLLRRRWRWLLSVNWGFGVCDLCAHACLLLVDQARQLPLRNCLRSLAQPTTSEELIVIGFKSVVFYTRPALTFDRRKRS